MKENIKNLAPGDLLSRLTGMGEERHRATQVMKWLWQKGARSFSDMTNLSLELRGRLDDIFRIPCLSVRSSVSSEVDGSHKFLFQCEDGGLVESVLMESDGRITICISSQIGCPLSCAFCRTGLAGLERDLRSDEILDQALIIRKNYIPDQRRYNIVLMGMGEPLLNLENVTRAVEILNHKDCFGLGEKRITLSTLGFPDRIGQLAATELKFGLAVSLSGTTDESRKKLMPSAAGIEETLEAAESFARSRGMRTTLEYVLISGVNDSQQNAENLAAMTEGRPFKINLIPFNEWEGCGYKKPSEESIENFIRILLPRAPAVTVRRSQGADIGAACGQLRADVMEYDQ
jgi:23S rRNA (adenine2503-C2)-methyltransferase